MWHRDVRGPRQQRGAVLVLVAVGMLAIIGMAGLALQSGHLYINKTNLQNALDAAAVSAAKKLKDGGAVNEASAAVAARSATTTMSLGNKRKTTTTNLSPTAAVRVFLAAINGYRNPPAPRDTIESKPGATRARY